MKQLSFMIGEWVGTSKIYKDGVPEKQGPAFERISYDLDSTIVVIELNSEFLQLRTIINYSDKDQIYYYHPFSKSGSGKYPAEFTGGQFVVNRDPNTKFFFGTTSDGGFQEYGARLVDGEWIRTFEDTFVNTK